MALADLVHQGEPATSQRIAEGRRIGILKRHRRCLMLVSIASMSLATGMGLKWGPAGYKYLQDRGPFNRQWEGNRTLKWGTLSPFWAQESVGADLARDFVESTTSESTIVPIGALDMGYDPRLIPTCRLTSCKSVEEVFRTLPPDEIPSELVAHGTGVLNLILGPEPVGVSARARLEVALGGRPYVRDSRDASFYPVINSKARLFSVPLVGFGPEAVAAFNTLRRDYGKIFVVGMGLPEGGDLAILRNQERIEGIRVASLTSEGRPQLEEALQLQVDVWVPAGEELQTILREKRMGGPYSSFGNASAAVGVTLGILADLTSFGIQLDVDEIRIILNRSGVPLKPGSNAQGIPMLNALKLARIGDRLRAMNWSRLSVETKKAILEGRDLYDFRWEALDLEKEALRQRESSAESSLREGLRNLRQSFFLRPDRDVATTIMEIYESEGLTQNALFWSALARSSPSNSDEN